MRKELLVKVPDIKSIQPEIFGMRDRVSCDLDGFLRDGATIKDRWRENGATIFLLDYAKDVVVREKIPKEDATLDELRKVVARFNGLCSELVKNGLEVNCETELLFPQSEEARLGSNEIKPSGFHLSVSVSRTAAIT